LRVNYIIVCNTLIDSIVASVVVCVGVVALDEAGFAFNETKRFAQFTLVIVYVFAVVIFVHLYSFFIHSIISQFELVIIIVLSYLLLLLLDKLVVFLHQAPTNNPDWFEIDNVERL